MIYLDKTEVVQDRFGDNTLKVKIPTTTNYGSVILDSFFSSVSNGNHTIKWLYESDSELFTLQVIVDYLREKNSECSIELVMPYVPNARQDRYVSDRAFTLKTFCKVINNMNFDRVTILDPHSNVTTALLDRVCVEPYLINTSSFDDSVVKMYPDEGAAKKYNATDKDIIGMKHRDKEGSIVDYQLLNFVEGTKDVLIVDDICSYGGTFVKAAEALKAKGVEHIYLLVSHCENNIEKGKVFEYIDKVFTTDDICTLQHEKIYYVKKYREEA